MSPLLYLVTIADQLETYLALLLLLAPLHYWLARRLAVNIFDPLFLVILADWFGFTLVSFMWINSDIRVEHFQYYVASQAALYAALLYVKRMNAGLRAPAFDPPYALVNWVVFFSLLVHLSATAVKWGLTGIPLFNASRLGAFAGSGGLGIIERFETGAFFLLTFSGLLLWTKFRARATWTTLGVVAWLLVYIAFSGSKGALLSILQVYFVVRVLVSDRSQASFLGSRLGGIAFVTAAVFSFAVLAVQSQGDFEQVLVNLAFRLVSFGDIYIYAYVDDTMRYINGDNPVIGLFGGALSTFRVIPGDWIYKNMGLQFTEIIFPGLDYLAGPNPRHNVFGFHFFGWWGVVYSGLLGLSMGWLQAHLYQRAHRGFFAGLVAFLLYFSLVSASGDFDYALSTLSSILLASILVLIPAHLFHLAGLRAQPSRHHASS
ncbi:hypothetical protein ACFJIX_02195 [Roseateles sp. UC29_93]|uniref:hypothetical protein n=1 Tax=Roseateles sp. UC29_93 TaxID=3350177 RepID=UPI00366D2145